MTNPCIQGLYIQNDIITNEQEQSIIKWLDTREWSTALPRRTQHFGYEYGYKSFKLTPAAAFDGPILQLSSWLNNTKILEGADQCIVNEYTRDQKIGKHIDRTDIFGPKIVSVSIGDDTNFIFKNTETNDKVEVHVPSRSIIIIMTGDARYKWTHEIPKRLSVRKDGKNIKKNEDYRRISLTFRKTTCN